MSGKLSRQGVENSPYFVHLIMIYLLYIFIVRGVHTLQGHKDSYLNVHILIIHKCTTINDLL